jgi:hypothetical protein
LGQEAAKKPACLKQAGFSEPWNDSLQALIGRSSIRLQRKVCHKTRVKIHQRIRELKTWFSFKEKNRSGTRLPKPFFLWEIAVQAMDQPTRLLKSFAMHSRS